MKRAPTFVSALCVPYPSELLIRLLLACRYLNPTFAVLFPFTLSFDKRIEEVNQAPVGEVKKDGKRDYKIFHRVFFFKR